MSCTNCHRSTDTARYKLAMRTTTADLCGECHASLTALGMTWVPERRAVDLTPIRERRQPEWLRRLTPKDFTGRVA